MNEIPNPEKLSDLILYTNRACLGQIRPNMRKISIQYITEENKVVLYVFCDKPFSQEELDYDVAGTILTEIISDFPQKLKWEQEVQIIPYPKKLPENGVCVYQRYEPELD
ncbi:MAG: hypothetical protein AAGG81_06665 [Chlamydiota bacterium]